MKNLICALVLFLISFYSNGQTSALGDKYYYQFNNAPKGMLNSLPQQPKEKVTSAFLYDYWREGDIYLKDSTKFEGLNIKIDLLGNMLNIKLDDGVRELPFRKLLALSFATYNQTEEIYISGETLLGKGSLYYDNIFQTLFKDEISLYGFNYVEILEPTSNQAISISVDNSAIIKKDFYFIYQQELIKVKSKSKLKKQLVGLFGIKVSPLVKKAKIKKEEDLIDLVSKLNEAIN